MPDPVEFNATTPKLDLPLLVAGQAQKEFFVNQALGIIDALQGQSVTASQSVPPPIAEEGDSFRVIGPATQVWQGYDDHIAIRIGGAWHFVAPQQGMMLFDKTADHILVFRSGWQKADAPAAPAGGSVIDVQARAAINQLIQALRTIGVLV